jgi:hypothetical protein
MNIKELAEQAGYKPLEPKSFADDLQESFLQRFAELVAAAERDKFWDALMSDLEHGVKSLNERASERFTKDYPALSREFEGDKHD